MVLTRRSANLYFNRLTGLGQASPATERQLDAFVDSAREAQVESCAVFLGAAARPAAIEGWLRDRGFTPAKPSAKTWRHGDALSRGSHARGIRVRRVSAAEVPVWVDVVSQIWRTFGSRRRWYEARARTPGWHHYLAWAGAEPVGAGALFVGDVGSHVVGHLVDGVTLGPWRRRGVQGAIIRKRVADGRRLGCDLFTSETAPPLPRMPLVSFRNLRRQGFELAYLRYAWRLDLR